jgi:hypothetical protein
MPQAGKDGHGPLYDFGSSVLTWVVGLAVVAGFAWFAFGQPNLNDIFGSGSSSTTEPAPPTQPYVDEDFEPTDQQIDDANREAWENVTGQQWSCFYDPSMNDNWHDDVVCTDGPTSHRPILLADWDFVTEDDMRAAAQDQENYLNAGGAP